MLTIDNDGSGADDILEFKLVGNDVHAKLGGAFVDTGADDLGANLLTKIVVSATAAIGDTTIDLSGLGTVSDPGYLAGAALFTAVRSSIA